MLEIDCQFYITNFHCCKPITISMVASFIYSQQRSNSDSSTVTASLRNSKIFHFRWKNHSKHSKFENFFQ